MKLVCIMLKKVPQWIGLLQNFKELFFMLFDVYDKLETVLANKVNSFFSFSREGVLNRVHSVIFRNKANCSFCVRSVQNNGYL